MRCSLDSEGRLGAPAHSESRPRPYAFHHTQAAGAGGRRPPPRAPSPCPRPASVRPGPCSATGRNGRGSSWPGQACPAADPARGLGSGALRSARGPPPRRRIRAGPTLGVVGVSGSGPGRGAACTGSPRAARPPRAPAPRRQLGGIVFWRGGWGKGAGGARGARRGAQAGLRGIDSTDSRD